jgi:hypothetical protein
LRTPTLLTGLRLGKMLPVCRPPSARGRSRLAGKAQDGCLCLSEAMQTISRLKASASTPSLVRRRSNTGYVPAASTDPDTPGCPSTSGTA